MWTFLCYIYLTSQFIFHNNNYPANCVFFSTNKGVKYTSVLFNRVPNKAFLVPDSYWATEKDGSSISEDVTENTIESD
jgi:hypothetical protein